MQFSERYGYKKVRENIQIESMDEPLRNGLWNVLTSTLWSQVEFSQWGNDLGLNSNSEIRSLCRRLWINHFKKPVDQLSDSWVKVQKELRQYFFSCEWFEVYDFIEFVARNYNRGNFKENFPRLCNIILEREVSAFRFVSGVISKITEQHEIDEIELALENARGPTRTHLNRALELLSDRQAPDYRNSIKEAISAVESLVAEVVGEKGTLGQLIKKLQDEIELHPALGSAFSNLYGYTSDADGIRHALMDAEKAGFEEAKFFLVVCSAFITFVDAKFGKKGVSKQRPSQ